MLATMLNREDSGFQGQSENFFTFRDKRWFGSQFDGFCVLWSWGVLTRYTRQWTRSFESLLKKKWSERVTFGGKRVDAEQRDQ